jgi:A/G-specific adenine glycosylase
MPARALTREQQALLRWGEATRRDLPWRRTRDPWAVLVAEVMLAQTQVERVEPRWAAFLERWPTPAALAGEPLAELLAFWQGLGYPRRAANLHATARVLAERHAGEVPDDLDALLGLPGVGAYTARAVLTFAFERDIGVVDTNIARVLARRAGARLGPAEAQAAADAWVPRGRGWEWNQTLMDVGALHCRPTARCGGCPLDSSCAWATAGHRGADPAKGSAGVSRRQAPYAGSDRQARGRLLRLLTEGPVPERDVAAAMGLVGDPARAERIAASLVDDGLIRLEDGRYLLG